MTLNITFRDLAVNLIASNPRIPLGEAGLETDTGFIKEGDGSTAWTDLEYFVAPIASPPASLADIAAVVDNAIDDGDTTTAPSENAVFDALAGKSNTGHTHVAANITDFTAAARTAVISQTVTNGVTTKSPSEDAVFDAIAAIPSGASDIDDLTDGKTDYPNDNVYLGQGVGDAVVAAGNTAIGSLALQGAAQYANTAMGSSALKNSTGTSNTGIGAGALLALVTGNQNTVLGWNCMANETSGGDNLGIGGGVGVSLISGSQNLLIGSGTDVSSAGAVNQMVIGYNAPTVANNKAQFGNTSITDVTFGAGTAILHANGSALTGITTGATSIDGLSDAKTTANSLFLGSGNGNALTSGVSNTGAGLGSTLASLTTGSYNTAYGNTALQQLVSGDSNTAIGTNALALNTTSNNTAVGNAAGGANTTGANLTAIGTFALTANNTGAHNTAVGYQALTSNTSQAESTAVGYNALRDNIGFQNTAVGSTAMILNTTGQNNVAMGYAAFSGGTTGDDNTAVGQGTLLSANGASGNTAIGLAAGNTVSSGSNNTFLGKNTNVGTGTLTNAMALGFSAVANASNTWVAGKLGTKQAIYEGANAAMGLATLVGGTVTVPNTLVSANSRIFLTAQDLGTVAIPSGYGISSRIAGTSFTILASVVTDTSDIAWEIKEPN